MNILIISASSRDNSNSLKLASWLIKNEFNKNNEVETSLLDLSLFPKLLSHYGKEQDKDPELLVQKEQVLSMLYHCDAVVVIAPEWGGMLPPALVNLFLLTANGSAGGLPLGHKPAFAIGVSSSGGGGNVISLMKAYVAKNSHLVWMPLHAVVQNVEEFLLLEYSPEQANRHSQIQSRIHVGLKSLVIHAKQLKPVREELVNLSKVHPFGQ